MNTIHLTSISLAYLHAFWNTFASRSQLLSSSPGGQFGSWHSLSIPFSLSFRALRLIYLSQPLCTNSLDNSHCHIRLLNQPYPYTPIPHRNVYVPLPSSFLCLSGCFWHYTWSHTCRNSTSSYPYPSLSPVSSQSSRWFLFLACTTPFSIFSPSSPSRSRFLLYTLRSHPYVPIFCPPTLSPVSARNNPVLSAILNQRCFIIPHHDSIRTYTSAEFPFRLRSSQPSVQFLFGPLSFFVFFACSAYLARTYARLHAQLLMSSC